MEVHRPTDLDDIADLGLTLAEAKRLLAGVQQEIVAAQARNHARQRPDCSRCDSVCCVKDYRDHARWIAASAAAVRDAVCCAFCTDPKPVPAS